MSRKKYNRTELEEKEENNVLSNSEFNSENNDPQILERPSKNRNKIRENQEIAMESTIKKCIGKKIWLLLVTGKTVSGKITSIGNGICHLTTNEDPNSNATSNIFTYALSTTSIIGTAVLGSFAENQT